MDDLIKYYNDYPQGTPDLEMEETPALEIDEEVRTELATHGRPVIFKSIEDIQCSKSKANKIQSAYKHIEYALSKKIDYSKKAMKDLDPEDFNHELVGKLATYFAFHARARCDEKLALLSCTTALGYMAAIKTYFYKKNR